MGKKRTKKFYTIEQPKDPNHIVVKTEDLKVRNLMHFEIQKNNRMIIQEDKRRKAPKYKKNYMEEL